MRTKIDEMIDSLIAFTKKYPGLWRLSCNNQKKATIQKYFGEDIDEEQMGEIIAQIDELKKYYRYIKTRPLTDEQIKKLKKTRIDYFVRDEDKVNIENEHLMQKFELSEKNLEQIRRGFGSVDEFRKTYIKALIENNVEEVIPVRILNSMNFVRYFDVSSPDLLLKNLNYIMIIRKAMDNQDVLTVIDSERLKNYIDDFLSKQRPEYKEIIEKRFGLNGVKRKGLDEIAKDIGISRTRVDAIRRYMLKKLQDKIESEQFNSLNIASASYNEFRAKFIEQYCKRNDIFMGDGKINKKNKQKLLDMLNEYRQEKVDQDKVELEQHKKRIELIDLETHIKKLHVAFYTYNCLKRANIETIGDLIKLNINDLKDIKNLNETSINEILYKVHRIGLKFKDEDYFLEQFENEEYQQMVSYNTKLMDKQTLLSLSTEELNLSLRAYNTLARVGVFTIGDLVSKSEDSLRKMRVGYKTLEEIKGKLQKLGLDFESEKEDEEENKQTENTAQDLGKSVFFAVTNPEESDKVQELLDFMRQFINPEEQQK